MLKGFFNFRYSHYSYRVQLVTLIRLKQKLGLKIEVRAQVDQFSKKGVPKKVKIFSIRDHHFNRQFLSVILVVSDRSEIEYFLRYENHENHPRILDIGKNLPTGISNTISINIHTWYNLTR